MSQIFSSAFAIAGKSMSEKASKIGELYRKLRDTEEELKQYKTNE